MKTTLGIGLLALTLVGCGTPVVATSTNLQGDKTTTVVAPTGEKMSSTEKSNGDVKIEANGTKLETSADGDQTGVALYPGAVMKDKALNVTAPQSSTSTVSYNTPDDVDKVDAFYKGQLGSTAKETKFSSDGESMASLVKDDDKVTISVTIDRKKADTSTVIVVTKVSK